MVAYKGASVGAACLDLAVIAAKVRQARAGKLEVELDVRFAKIVPGDLANAPQPIAQRVAVDTEGASRVPVVLTTFEVRAEGRDKLRAPYFVIVK